MHKLDMNKQLWKVIVKRSQRIKTNKTKSKDAADILT